MIDPCHVQLIIHKMDSFNWRQFGPGVDHFRGKHSCRQFIHFLLCALFAIVEHRGSRAKGRFLRP
jgi:hypothetical protein